MDCTTMIWIYQAVLLLVIMSQNLSGTLASSTLSAVLQPTPSTNNQKNTTSSTSTLPDPSSVTPSLAVTYEVTEEWLTTTMIDLQPTPIPTPEQLAMRSHQVTPTPTPEQINMESPQISPTAISNHLSTSSQVTPSPTPEQLVIDTPQMSSAVLHTPENMDSSSVMPTTSTVDVVDIDTTTIVPSVSYNYVMSSVPSSASSMSSKTVRTLSSEVTPVVAMTTIAMQPTPTITSRMITHSYSLSPDDILMTTLLSSVPFASLDQTSVSLQVTPSQSLPMMPVVSASATTVKTHMIMPTSHIVVPMETSSVILTSQSPTAGTPQDSTTISLTELLTEYTTDETPSDSSGNATQPITSVTTVLASQSVTTSQSQETTSQISTNSSRLSSTRVPFRTTGRTPVLCTNCQTDSPTSEVNVTLTFDGECQPVLAKEDIFRNLLKDTLQDMLSIKEDRLHINNIQCGSIITGLTVMDNAQFDISEDLLAGVNEGNFTLEFEGKILTAKHIEFQNGPFAETTPTATDDNIDKVTDGGMPFEKQKMFIYYVIGGAVGLVLVIVVIVLMHHCVHRKCQTHAQSFNISDGPVVKLSEFNMAHTYIPRPRSIYGNTLGADGKYSMYGSLPRGLSSTHSSAYYSSEDDVHKQFEEVPQENGIRRFSNEFGHSVPEWNLPRLEGVVRQTEVTSMIHSSTSTLASTPGSFRSPPRGTPPPTSNGSTTSTPHVTPLLAHHHRHHHNHNPVRPRKAPPPPPPPPPPPNTSPPPPPVPPAPAAPPPPPPPPPSTSSTHSSLYQRDGVIPSPSRPSICSDYTDSSGDTRSLIRNGSDSTPSISGLDNPGLVSDVETEITGAKPPRPPPPPRTSTLSSVMMDRVPVTV